MTKGIHVLYTGREADRTHNIAIIFNKLFNEKENREIVEDTEFEDKSKEYIEFFAELLYYYISERYPNYKKKLSWELLRR